MPIFEFFSKRQKKCRGDVTDVYKYNEIPQKLKTQVIHIVKDTIGIDSGCGDANFVYTKIHKVLCKEYGVFSLSNTRNGFFHEIYEFFLEEKDYEKCLDIIEVTFSYINDYIRKNPYRFFNCQSPDSAINELNDRFKEASVGYKFESGEIIRVDSQYIHSEVVQPVLKVLGGNKKYKGTNNEFLLAHEHYKHKRYTECLNECLKAFESLMKAIHDIRSWEYQQNYLAKKLISSCLINNLFPEYLQNQFSSVRTVLESGVPTLRNKLSAHGSGTEVIDVPEHFASYALHLTATNLLFLAKCEEQYS